MGAVGSTRSELRLLSLSTTSVGLLSGWLLDAKKDQPVILYGCMHLRRREILALAGAGVTAAGAILPYQKSDTFGLPSTVQQQCSTLPGF